jgi:hypothetical protein
MIALLNETCNDKSFFKKFNTSETWNILYQTLLIQVGIEIMLFFINTVLKRIFKDNSVGSPQYQTKISILAGLWVIIFYGMYYITMTINNNHKNTYCNDNMYKCVNLGTSIIHVMSTLSILILGWYNLNTK